MTAHKTEETSLDMLITKKWRTAWEELTLQLEGTSTSTQEDSDRGAMTSPVSCAGQRGHCEHGDDADCPQGGQHPTSQENEVGSTCEPKDKNVKSVACPDGGKIGTTTGHIEASASHMATDQKEAAGDILMSDQGEMTTDIPVTGQKEESGVTMMADKSQECNMIADKSQECNMSKQRKERSREEARENRNRSSLVGQKSRSVPPPASRQLSCLNCPSEEESLSEETELAPEPEPLDSGVSNGGDKWKSNLGVIGEGAKGRSGITMGANISSGRGLDCCSCPRKRKEPQDLAQEIDRKFSRSSSLERNHGVVSELAVRLNLLKEVQQHNQSEKCQSRIVEEEIEFDCNHNNLPSFEDGNYGSKVGSPTNPSNGGGSVPEVITSSEVINKMEAPEDEDTREERRNSMSFMPAYRAGSHPPPISMRSSGYSGLVMMASANRGGYDSDRSEEASDRSETGSDKMDTDEGYGGSWVSRQLAHVMSVDLAKETLTSQLSYEGGVTTTPWINTASQMSPCSLSPLPELDDSSPASRYLENSRTSQHHVPLARRSSDGIERSRIKSLTKQLSNVKRQIEELEAEFCRVNGYRPSQIDRLSDSRLRNLVAEQTRLKRDLKEARSPSRNVSGGSSSTSAAKNLIAANNASAMSEGGAASMYGSRSAPGSRRGSLTDDCANIVSLKVETMSGGLVSPGMPHMQAIRQKLDIILAKLEDDRKVKGRPTDCYRMSMEQVFEEKLEIQKLLLDYENEFGHPESGEEREIMKDIYERYRVIKRLARRSSSARSREVVELVTIPEDQALTLTLASPAHRLELVTTTTCSTTPRSTHGHTSAAGQTVVGSSLPASRHNMDLPNFHSRQHHQRQLWQQHSACQKLGSSARSRLAAGCKNDSSSSCKVDQASCVVATASGCTPSINSRCATNKVNSCATTSNSCFDSCTSQASNNDNGNGVCPKPSSAHCPGQPSSCFDSCTDRCEELVEVCDTSCQMMDETSSCCSQLENSCDKLSTEKEKDKGGDCDSSFNYHSMSREDLLELQKKIREEKKVARRAVKEFEENFRQQTGRRVTKEDREPLEKTYRCYKTSKSKLKLITVLLTKTVDISRS